MNRDDFGRKAGSLAHIGVPVGCHCHANIRPLEAVVPKAEDLWFTASLSGSG